LSGFFFPFFPSFVSELFPIHLFFFPATYFLPSSVFPPIAARFELFPFVVLPSSSSEDRFGLADSPLSLVSF